MLFPTLGDMPVSMIDKVAVIRALDPIWARTPVTASRLRGRLEGVLAWAKVRDLRTGDNPASWELLKYAGFKEPARAKHHTALPYARMGEFMEALRRIDTAAARCLEFLILTAARAGEATGAMWGEVDLANRVWTLPASRMKGGREHRVPLSDAAMAVVLERMPRGSGPIFGARSNTIRALAARMAGKEATVHGFRSTFRTWADEQTSYPHHVVEQALAHTIGTKVERAYRRGDLFEKRRRLMDAWAEFCRKPAARGAVLSFGNRAQ
jgi:integrase